jgi:hypothetical protein
MNERPVERDPAGSIRSSWKTPSLIEENLPLGCGRVKVGHHNHSTRGIGCGVPSMSLGVAIVAPMRPTNIRVFRAGHEGDPRAPRLDFLESPRMNVLCRNFHDCRTTAARNRDPSAVGRYRTLSSAGSGLPKSDRSLAFAWLVEAADPWDRDRRSVASGRGRAMRARARGADISGEAVDGKAAGTRIRYLCFLQLGATLAHSHRRPRRWPLAACPYFSAMPRP